MTLSWAQISEDSDQKYAFSEITNYCHQFELQSSSFFDLSHVMLAVAINAMDYEDPWDHRRDLSEDPMRARKIRLANFMDYTYEFAEKRLALVQDGDRYLDQKTDHYNKSKKQMRVLQTFSDAAHTKAADIEYFMGAFDGLKDQLLMEGVDRVSLSKAFLDAGFVFAKQAPLDDYISFCNYISSTLNPDAGQAAPEEHLLEHDDQDCYNDAIFLNMEAASASIH
ncbi:MAG: hypothetical protein CMH27_09180 [Micavibrio sp.]|nr:hypothetical protein [Micavibrio sp.]|tara:strand:- start:6102 stop:6773 length:672 start_codon:yes stop_codon:yes gene_type:complete